MPVISVIVPVYNVEKYLHRCVDSILAQTFTDFELILVDDGSPDNCGKICDEYAKKDSRIHVIHKKNVGLPDARNAGIDWAFKNSDSEWLTFIDSDDWVHPDYLKLLYKAVTVSQTDIGIGLIEKTEKQEDYLFLSNQFSVRGSIETFKDFSQKMTYVSACGKLYKKELFKTIRFPIGKLWEDLFTTYKVFLLASKCSELNDVIYFYYLNNDGIIRRNWIPKRMDEFEAYESLLDFFKEKKEYQELYIAFQTPYILAISYSYDMCIHSDLSKREIKHYSRIISARMRKALKKFRKTIDFPFKEYNGIYETAHPKLMNVYYIINGKINKFKKA